MRRTMIGNVFEPLKFNCEITLSIRDSLPSESHDISEVEDQYNQAVKSELGNLEWDDAV